MMLRNRFSSMFAVLVLSTSLAMGCLPPREVDNDDAADDDSAAVDDDASGDLTPPLLAQLISDRCRELGELTAAYRRALVSPGRHAERDGFKPPY